MVISQDFFPTFREKQKEKRKSRRKVKENFQKKFNLCFVFVALVLFCFCLFAFLDMGFESTIDILDDDVNKTADFSIGESDLDSITDNNFTYGDGHMTGDDVTVDQELLFDHDDDDNNNNSVLVVRAKSNGPLNLYLPKGIPTKTITTPPKNHQQQTPVFPSLTPHSSPLPLFLHSFFFSSLPSKNNRLFRGTRRVCKRGRA